MLMTPNRDSTPPDDGGRERDDAWGASAMSEPKRPPHDERCEGEWESGAMAYTVCACAERREQSSESERWETWKRAWRVVSPLAEAQPWFRSLGAHTQSYTKEAIAHAIVGHPTRPDPIRSFCLMELPADQFDVWCDRLRAVHDQAKASL